MDLWHTYVLSSRCHRVVFCSSENRGFIYLRFRPLSNGLLPIFQVKVVITLSVMLWIFSLVVATTGYVIDCNTWLCLINGACSNNCSAFLGLFHSLSTVPCCIIPIILYALLFVKAKKAEMATTSVTANVSAPKQAGDWKAIITFFLMFLTIFGLTLPNLVLVFTVRGLYDENDVPLGLYLLSVIATRLLTLIPTTDAVLILRNRDVKEVLREIIEKCHAKADN